jgi:tetratricopeptide (TPR) repeat protein
MTRTQEDPYSTITRLRGQAHAAGAAHDLLVQLATLELRLGLVAEADATIAIAVRRAPKSMDLRLDWAKTALLQGDFLTALKRCDGALKRAPKSVAFLRFKTRLLELLGREKDAEVVQRSALGALRTAGKQHPEDAELCRVTAQALMTAGHFAEAQSYYERLLGLQPGHPDTLVALAQLNLWHGKAAPAQKLAAEALRSQKDHRGALRASGAAYVMQRQYKKSVTVLTQLLERFPKDGEGYVWRAEALAKLKKTKDCLADCRRALEFSDNALGGNASAARLMLEAGQEVTAIEYLLIARLLPRPWRAWRKELSVDDHVRSLKTLKRILKQIPGNRGQRNAFLRKVGTKEVLTPYVCIDVADEMERVQMRLRGESRAAVFKEFNRRLTGKAQDAWVYAFLGETRLWYGDYAGAIKEFRNSLKKDATIRWPHVGLGAAAMLEGRFQEALGHFDDAIRDKAPDRAWSAWRGETFRRMGRHEEAVADLRRNITLLPTRFSGRLNLALSMIALGEAEKVAPLCAEISATAPHFMSIAARAAGYDAPLARLQGLEEQVCILEKALELMRGNRSSWMPTYVDEKGRVHSLCADAEDLLLDL